MDRLEASGWLIEYDRPATIAAFERTPRDGPETCGCDSCRNWAESRDQLHTREFLALLHSLGIPCDHEREVYHNGRLESGLHCYGAWYNFVGRVLRGSRESAPNLVFGALSVYFSTDLVLLPEAFEGQPVVQLEVGATVPWLTRIPESA